MVLAISTPTTPLLPSSSSPSSPAGVKTSYFSNSAISIPKNVIFRHNKCVPQLGFTHFSQWNGLKKMGVSISQCPAKMERKGRCRGKGVYASLFGVGAPEVLVIGVVALLVFGPKGLAEVARNLGKTLRTFQPTIRELQEVSREFKSTLEREIGLDDINDPVPRVPSSNETKPTSEDLPTELGTDIETRALAQLQKEQEEERQLENEKDQSLVVSKTPSEDTPTEDPSATPPSENLGTKALQEAASVLPGAPSPDTETRF